MNWEKEKILDTTSRDYFNDIVILFYSQKFNISIILLYNLVIYDLYKKLIFMSENGIIDESSDSIKNLISSDDKYSNIERKIIKKYTEKGLLNPKTITDIKNLNNLRNLCAHPIYAMYDNNASLKEEETRQQIDNMYSEILSVGAFIKDPYNLLKSSLISYDISIKEDENEIKRFSDDFEKQYFYLMNNSSYQSLFKSLVEQIFKQSSPSAEIIENQYRNFLLLRTLLNYISKNTKIEILKNYYNWNNIKKNKIYDYQEKNWFSLRYLLKILAEFPQYYFIDEIKEKNELLYNHLKDNVDTNASLFVDYYSIFYKHIESRFNYKVKYDFCKEVLQKCSNKFELKSLLKIMGKIFSKINKSDQADDMIDILIDIVKGNNKEKLILTTDNILKILEIMNNNEVYFNKTEKRINQLESLNNNSEIDLSPYKNLII